MPKITRGFRNNNPGNIEKGDPWQGLCKPEDMTDVQKKEPRFAVFAAPKWGIRAIAVTLITYQDKHGLSTVSDLLKRWAPAFENNVTNYAKFVADKAGVGVDDQINVHEYATMRPLVEAIIRYENGYPTQKLPKGYGPEVLDEALKLAGVNPPPTSLVRDSVAKGQAGVASGVAGTTVASMITDSLNTASAQLQPLIPYAEVLKYVFIAISLASIAYTVYNIVQRQRRER